MRSAIRRPGRLVRGAAEHLLGAQVPRDDPAVLVDGDERVQRRLQDRAEDLLAVAQGRLGRLGVGDVGEDAEPDHRLVGRPAGAGRGDVLDGAVAAPAVAQAVLVDVDRVRARGPARPPAPGRGRGRRGAAGGSRPRGRPARRLGVVAEQVAQPRAHVVPGAVLAGRGDVGDAGHGLHQEPEALLGGGQLLLPGQVALEQAGVVVGAGGRGDQGGAHGGARRGHVVHRAPPASSRPAGCRAAPGTHRQPGART